EVSTKLESVFKEQEKLYKNQKIWRYVKGEYKYDRKVIDSIFTQYNLHDSEDFYIITSTDDLADYSLEIKSIDKNIQLKFNDGYRNLSLLPNTVGMSYSGTFEDLGGDDFYDYMKKTPQEELSDCSKTAPMINSTMVLFTYYNKGNITVKRFETCDYS